MKKYLIMLVCLFAVVSLTFAQAVRVDCGNGDIHNLPDYVDADQAYDDLCG